MYRSPANRTAQQHGAVLIPIIFLMMLIAGLSMSLLIEVEGSVTSVKHQETSIMALEIAEMGVVQAELEIRGARDGGSDGIGNVSGNFAGGDYEVTAVEDPALDGRWRITSIGTHGHSVRRIEVGVRRRMKRNAVEGLYAKDALTFGGNSTTDAFDSRLGTYAAQAVNNDGGGTYALGGGHMGSGMGITVLGSSAHVRGNAIPGPGFATEISGGATVWGDTLPRLTTLDLPPTPYDEFLAAYNSNQNATLTGHNAVVDPEVGVSEITDSDLTALADAEVEALAETDMLLLTDSEVSLLTYDALLTDDYATKITTVDSTSTLWTYKTEEYEVLMLDDAVVFTIDADIAVVSDTTTTTTGGGGGGGGGNNGGGGNTTTTDTTDTTTTPTTTPTTTTSNSLGRVSYDATTMELRATAGAELVLTGGTYFFSDVRLVGNSKLIVRGPSKVYVTGSFDLGGGTVVNETGKAENLQIFGHGYALPPSSPPSKTQIKVRGGTDIAAMIYAPEVDVTVGGGDNFYGAVVGNQIALLGGVLYHYDKALGDLYPNEGALLERLYWRELSTPRR